MKIRRSGYSDRVSHTLHDRLRRALDDADLAAVAGAEPVDDADTALTLLAIYDLWTAPIERLGGTERLQNHPVVADLKWRLEQRFTTLLGEWSSAAPPVPNDAPGALRRIARTTSGEIYDWIATSATWDQLVRFLAVEGGPDGGFDDLVALSQVGIQGPAKVVLGANYWDEMGRGEPDAVHTVLHQRLVAAVDLEHIPRHELPLSALWRIALNGLFATNRCLQPEMIGALGLLELQAGPRCRKVLQAFERLGAPADAYPFYAEHAATDPRHGKEWLDGAVVRLVEEHPAWGPRMVRGATWRAETNRRLFDDLHDLLREGSVARSA